jgi:predicted flap endonuclease-1-like 5' DNA nuclease
MTDSTLLVIGAAVLLLAVVLILLALTGRKPVEGPQAPTADELRTASPDEPLPEPGAAPGLPTAALAPTPELAAEPLPAEVPTIIVEPAGPPDELTRMKGLGPKAAALLAGLGVTRYDQIAGWGAADVERVDAQMGAFKGRIVRDRWVEQARFLAAGDTAGFEERFGKLG